MQSLENLYFGQHILIHQIASVASQAVPVWPWKWGWVNMAQIFPYAYSYKSELCPQFKLACE